MSSKLARWIRSRTGLATIGGVLIALLAIVLVGQQFGWWESLGLSGAAGVEIKLPPVEYADPQGGYTCFPTCVENDGKFLMIANNGVKTFAGVEQVFWIGVPGNKESFDLGIFDGDSGLDNAGQANLFQGNWDDSKTEALYTLYADPLKDGQGMTVVASWKGNTDQMPNNAWFNQTIQNVDAAKAPSRHYFYRLVVSQETESNGGNAFKLRSTGYITSGKSELVQSSIAFVGGLGTKLDANIIYPEFKSLNDVGPSTTYNGEWKFYMYVPKDSQELSIWDGDFDRGTNANDPMADTDDPNTTNKPEWAGPYTKDEGRGGKGIPNDDYAAALYRSSPAVIYNLIDPAGDPIYTNDNPSGTEEWEQFTLTTDPAYENPDMLVERIQPGFYALQVVGLDLHNLAFLRTDMEVCDINSGCGPCVWPGCNATDSCPRTIGYWKNNAKKVYGGKTNGVQEGLETLDWAVKSVALQSPIYRNGLVSSLTDKNATTVKAIATAAPLTKDEVQAILQKKTKLGNSMLGRALQQNLATWLNLASGKISDNSIVTIEKDGNVIFEGTMMEALLEAQNIMLNGGDIERAKDIADMINNGQITGDVDSDTENVDAAGNVSCSIYGVSIKKEKQPKKYDELPKPPVPTDIPPVVEEPTCSMPGTNVADGLTIVALNPADCQGQQNGLLFHGTSLSKINGTAFSNGCLRSVGTHSVQVSNGDVEYAGENFGDMTLIQPEPVKADAPLAEGSFQIAAPDCSHPDAHNINGKDWKGDVVLEPGLYCVTGGLDINANQKFEGQGVTIYVMDGDLKINGNATVNLTAPFTSEDPSPALNNILFYVNGSEGNTNVTINGTSDSYFEGTVYAPGSELEILGTGNVVAWRSQFIGWDVRVGGTADLLIDYIGSDLPTCEP